MSEFNNLLVDTLTSCDQDGTFSTSQFFSEWFRVKGNSYLFLFKKNLRVTNIQYAELLSLIRTNIKFNNSNREATNIQFFSTSEFNNTIQTLINSLPHNPLNGYNRYEKAVEYYGSIFQYAVVIDIFFGSCVVFIPPQLEINLKSICALSGYIHSCGFNIFVRRVDKTQKSDFFKAISNHISKNYNGNQPIFFAVYAHEDFSDFDRRLASSLRDGLDDVKIYIEKFYMGSDSLVTVLKNMQQYFKGQLVIPEPGNYNKKHKEFRDNEEIDPTRTIWLIVDHSINQETNQKGLEKYYLCYEQQYINKNPFHIFDENKPAWIAHTTIPHTLAGAMVNITSPFWSNDKNVVICDPFCGTGTIWLETLKYENINIKSRDAENIVPLLASDNAAFFSASSEELEEYLSDLNKLQSHPTIISKYSLDNCIDNDITSSYNQAISILERVKSQGENISFSNEIVDELINKTRFQRLLFYLCLRTTLRHVAAFSRESEDWTTAFLKEVRMLSFQIEDLNNLRKSEENENQRSGALSTFPGSYSVSCTINPEKLNLWRDLDKVKSICHVSDARTIEPNSCDVIISDPPYGFNVEHDIYKLASLYSEVIKVMIKALRNNGQLVLCLPEMSYTGRLLPFFTDKQIITKQVFTAVEETGREVVISASKLPESSKILQAPYYWESERALRRSILHFRIRNQ